MVTFVFRRKVCQSQQDLHEIQKDPIGLIKIYSTSLIQYKVKVCTKLLLSKLLMFRQTCGSCILQIVKVKCSQTDQSHNFNIQDETVSKAVLFRIWQVRHFWMKNTDFSKSLMLNTLEQKQPQSLVVQKNHHHYPQNFLTLYIFKKENK